MSYIILFHYSHPQMSHDIPTHIYTRTLRRCHLRTLVPHAMALGKKGSNPSCYGMVAALWSQTLAERSARIPSASSTSASATRLMVVKVAACFALRTSRENMSLSRRKDSNS